MPPPNEIIAYLAPCTCRRFVCADPHAPDCHLNDAIDPDPVGTVNTPVGWVVICRSGVPKAEGGEGITWYCSCPHANVLAEDGHHTRRVCPHLQAIYTGTAEAKNPWGFSVTEDPIDAAPGRFLARLTPRGSELLRPKWLVNMIRRATPDDGEPSP